MEIKITIYTKTNMNAGSIFLEDKDITSTLREKIQKELEDSLHIGEKGAHIKIN